MGRKETEQGGATEERVVAYFRSRGFFTVRASKLRFANADVTDIDVWVYARASTGMRERAIVDAKDRTRPKAMERIVWATGIRKILQVDRVFVATTDKRATIHQFAHLHGVEVLDGVFLNHLEGSLPPRPDRMSLEQFCAAALPEGDDKLLGDWRNRFEESKSRALTDLTFDGCVGWLEDIRYFMLAASSQSRRASALRLVYFSTALFLVGLDHALREILTDNREERVQLLNDGLKFGTRGRENFTDLLAKSEALLTRFFPDLRGAASSVRSRALSEVDQIPTNLLAEYFSREDISSDLFGMALLFEEAAYASEFREPAHLETKLKSTLGVLLDYNGLDRGPFLKESRNDG